MLQYNKRGAQGKKFFKFIDVLALAHPYSNSGPLQKQAHYVSIATIADDICLYQ